VLRFLIAAREEVDSTQLRDDLLSMLVAGHETTGGGKGEAHEMGGEWDSCHTVWSIFVCVWEGVSQEGLNMLPCY
jgi:hypothetical protein